MRLNIRERSVFKLEDIFPMNHILCHMDRKQRRNQRETLEKENYKRGERQ